MTTYNYCAFDTEGHRITGTIEAGTTIKAEALIVEQGNIPLEISEKSSLLGNFSITTALGLNKVPAADLILFTRQFSVMIRAGIPMLRLLSILREQTDNDRLKSIVDQIIEDIQAGADLSSSFAKHPAVFNQLYCSLIHAGETSGALDQVLEQLTHVLTHEFKVRSDIKSALRYPMIVISFLAVAFAILLTFVIPKFVKIFERAKIDLPWQTKVCINLSNIFQAYWPIIIIVIVGLFIGYKLILKTRAGLLFRDKLLLNLPLIGPLLNKSVMSRFASIFAILQHSGVSVLSSIDILCGSIGNTAISEEFKAVGKQLEKGKGISAPLKEARYFPPLVVNMIAVGEESGKLDDMLAEISKHYDVELEYAVKKLMDALPAILTISLAVVVGFFALAIYMPMWDLTKMGK